MIIAALLAAALLPLGGCAALPTAALTIGGEILVKATELDTAVIENLCARGVIPPTMRSCQVPASVSETKP